MLKQMRYLYLLLIGLTSCGSRLKVDHIKDKEDSEYEKKNQEFISEFYHHIFFPHLKSIYRFSPCIPLDEVENPMVYFNPLYERRDQDRNDWRCHADFLKRVFFTESLIIGNIQVKGSLNFSPDLLFSNEPARVSVLSDAEEDIVNLIIFSSSCLFDEKICFTTFQLQGERIPDSETGVFFWAEKELNQWKLFGFNPISSELRFHPHLVSDTIFLHPDHPQYEILKFVFEELLILDLEQYLNL